MLHGIAAMEADQQTAKETAGKYALEMTFSRGLSTGWLEGIDNQQLVHARFGKKRGLRIGEVERIEREGIWLQTDAPLKAGDGVVFDRGRPDEFEEGGRITSVDTSNKGTFIRFLKGSIDWKRVAPGNTLYKTSDPALDKALRQSYEVEQPNYKRPIRATVSGKIGEVLVISLQDEDGRIAQVKSDQVIEAARNQPTDDTTLQKQLGRLGNTAFFLQSLDNQLGDGCMIPASMLNKLRRDAVELLVVRRAQPLRWELKQKPRSPEPIHSSTTHPYLIPYVRNWEQFDVALGMPYAEIYIELEDPRKYAEAVQRARQAEQQDGRARGIWVAPPASSKPARTT